jgi:hypothetical protein
MGANDRFTFCMSLRRSRDALSILYHASATGRHPFDRRKFHSKSEKALMKLAILLALPLAACQTVGLPLDAQFPAVPSEIQACAKRAPVKFAAADMSAHDVEMNWKADRYNAVVLRQCLRRLIVRDQKLAKGS